MTKHCTTCGHELREGDTFCSKCGTPVSGSAALQSPGSSPVRWEYKDVELDFNEVIIHSSPRLPKFARARGGIGRNGAPLANVRFRYEYNKKTTAWVNAMAYVRPILQQKANELGAEGWELTEPLEKIPLDNHEYESNLANLLVFFAFLAMIFTLGLSLLATPPILTGYYRFTGARFPVRRMLTGYTIPPTAPEPVSGTQREYPQEHPSAPPVSTVQAAVQHSPTASNPLANLRSAPAQQKAPPIVPVGWIRYPWMVRRLLLAHLLAIGLIPFISAKLLDVSLLGTWYWNIFYSLSQLLIVVGGAQAEIVIVAFAIAAVIIVISTAAYALTMLAKQRRWIWFSMVVASLLFVYYPVLGLWAFSLFGPTTPRTPRSVEPNAKR